MDRSYQRHNEEQDAMLNQSLSEAEIGEPITDDELRRARIAEYEQASLQKADPLSACLGATNAGLLRMGLQYEQAILQSLADKETSILDSPQLQRGMNTQLGITRQVERFANLDVRLSENERQAEQGKSQRSLAALHRPTGTAPRRNPGY